MNANTYCDKQYFTRRAKSKHARIVVLHDTIRREAPVTSSKFVPLPYPHPTSTKNKWLNLSDFAMPTLLMCVSNDCLQLPPPEVIPSLRHRRHEPIAA